MQEPKLNHYLIVEPGTKLLTSVSSYKFEEIKWNVLTWFTACNNFDTVMDQCSNCDLCLAGIMNHRLYYDGEYKIIMHLPKENQLQRHDKIKMKLFSQEHVLAVNWFNNMFNVSGIHHQSQFFRKAYFRCSRGNFIEENQSLRLADGNGISTTFNTIE